MSREAEHGTVTCPTCGGSGWEEPDADNRITCRECGGHGQLVLTRRPGQAQRQVRRT